MYFCRVQRARVGLRQWRRQLWGTGARAPPLDFFSKDHALQIRVDSYSNSARKVDIVQCGARSGASD